MNTAFTIVAIYLVLGGAFIAFFSWLATVRNIGLCGYWVGVGAAFAPWMLTIIITGVMVNFLPQEMQQGGTMALMFPLFACVAVLLVSSLVSLFLADPVSLPRRALWFGGISGVPALCMLAFLLWVLTKDS